jgi:hypothetical protein
MVQAGGSVSIRDDAFPIAASIAIVGPSEAAAEDRRPDAART